MLAKRKGFVKLAMQTGAAIIPAYTFGTNQMFYRPCGPNSLLAKLSGALQVSIDGYPASRECVACDSCSSRGARAPIPIYVYLQVSVTPWCGRGYVPFSPVPFRVPVLSVLGEVFEVPHKAEPTHAEVEMDG